MMCCPQRVSGSIFDRAGPTQNMRRGLPTVDHHPATPPGWARPDANHPLFGPLPRLARKVRLMRTLHRLVGALALALALVVPLVGAPAAHAIGGTVVTSTTITAPGGCALPLSVAWGDRLANLAVHPRVVFGAADRQRLYERAIDPTTKPFFGNYVSWGNSVLSTSLPSYSTGSLASVSSTAIGHIQALGFRFMGYESVGLPNYPRTDVEAVQDAMAERIKQEIFALASFPEWNQNVHFMETSGIALAVSMGYSLIHDRLTPSERTTIVTALVSKALAPATCLWQQNHRWVYSVDNWAVITNASMIATALAVADEEPLLAAAALAAAQPRMNRALKVLSSDGGSPEGPSYVAFQGNYATFALASLWNSLPEGDRTIQTVPAAARWSAAIYGPTGQPFNFADSDTALGKELLPVWNAFRGGDRLGSWLANRRMADGQGALFYLLWYTSGGVNPSTALGRTPLFPRTGVVTLRNGYGSGDSWIAVKGGSNAGGHSHRELGSYVLDMRGVRWVSDYGKDDYALYKYFVEKTRETYFRANNESASTVGVAGRIQPSAASAPIATPWVDSAGVARTWLDMHQAVGVSAARRNVAVSSSGSVSVGDTVRSNGSVTLRWMIHTQASVGIAADGRSALLSRRDASGTLRQVRLSISGTRGLLRQASAPATRDLYGHYGYSNAGFTRVYLSAATGVPPGSTQGTAAITATYTVVR